MAIGRANDESSPAGIAPPEELTPQNWHHNFLWTFPGDPVISYGLGKHYWHSQFLCFHPDQINLAKKY
jgi:hypothetical protein